MVSSTGTTGAAAADSDIIEDLEGRELLGVEIRGQTTRLELEEQRQPRSFATRARPTGDEGRLERKERLTIVVYGKRARALWPCLLQGRRENEREREIGREKRKVASTRRYK